MADGLFVISGASGHVGSVLTQKLLDQKKRVRVIGRNADKLKPFTSRGAEAVTGSLEDNDFTKRAFAGAQAVFAMIPPNFAANGLRPYQKRVVAAIGRGLSTNRVPFVVTLSSIGADLPEGNGPMAGLYELEQRVNKSGAESVLHLRPGPFMESAMGNIPMIKRMGINGGAIKPDVRLQMIFTRDIGEVAAYRMGALDFKGRSVLELMGPKDITMTEATSTIGKAIGRPELKYVQFPYEEAIKGMVEMGLPKDVAAAFVEMSRSFNEGKIKSTQPRSPATTTPTTFEWFAQNVFAPAFKAS